MLDKNKPKSISELKNKEKGKNLYIVCTGNSLSSFKKEFFKNKTIIGVNRVFELISCNYIVIK